MFIQLSNEVALAVTIERDVHASRRLEFHESKND